MRNHHRLVYKRGRDACLYKILGLGMLSLDMLGYTCLDEVSESTWRFILSQARHGSAMPTTVGDMRSLSVGMSK